MAILLAERDVGPCFALGEPKVGFLDFLSALIGEGQDAALVSGTNRGIEPVGDAQMDFRFSGIDGDGHGVIRRLDSVCRGGGRRGGG